MRKTKLSTIRRTYLPSDSKFSPNSEEEAIKLLRSHFEKYVGNQPIFFRERNSDEWSGPKYATEFWSWGNPVRASKRQTAYLMISPQKSSMTARKTWVAASDVLYSHKFAVGRDDPRLSRGRSRIPRLRISAPSSALRELPVVAVEASKPISETPVETKKNTSIIDILAALVDTITEMQSQMITKDDISSLATKIDSLNETVNAIVIQQNVASSNEFDGLFDEDHQSDLQELLNKVSKKSA